jgi:tRNA(Ile)-lysidine synthase TilS/MesJ
MTIIPGSKAILGFSGGVDSVVLSHWLLQRYNIRPYLLHVNYGLREEADEDERWCRWFAQEHRFEIEVLHADPTRRKERTFRIGPGNFGIIGSRNVHKP